MAQIKVILLLKSVNFIVRGRESVSSTLPYDYSFS